MRWLLLKLLWYKPYPSTSSWFMLLLLSAILLIPATRSNDAGDGDYSYNYDYNHGIDNNMMSEQVLNIIKHNMTTLKEDLLACCNGTNAEIKEELNSEKVMLLDKLGEIAEKSDMENISTILKNLVVKTDVAYLVEVVSALPTHKSISSLKENPYSEEHLGDIKRIYQLFFNTIMDEMTNSSSSLKNDLDKMKEVITSIMTFQNNDTKIRDKINELSTHKSFQNITNEFIDIATKEDLQSTNKQIIDLNHILKNSLSEDNLQLKDYLTHEDVEALIPIFSNIISLQDLEHLHKEISLLSSENSVNVLSEKIVALAKKEQLESMGVFIDDYPLIIKNDLLNLNLLGVANKIVVKALDDNVNALEEEIDEYQDQLLELTDIARKLLEDLEMQDKIINALDLHINKLSTSEGLVNLKELLLATYSTTNASLEYVEGQEVMTPSSKILTVTNPPNDCVHKNIVEERMIDLHSDIDSVCKNYKLQDLVFTLETNILQKIENISNVARGKEDCQTPSTPRPKTKLVPEALPCMDSEFMEVPYRLRLDVCSTIVSKNLCNADPLMGYHCCRSCVNAEQMEEEGPHRYIQAPRKVNYSSAKWAMTLKKRKL